MAQEKIYDVIIVGAGPGGSATAISLARSGWDVLLLEKHTFPRDKVCGDLLSPRSLRVLQKLDCLEAIVNSSSNRLDGGTLIVNGQKINTANIPKIDDLPAYGYALPRYIFDEIVFRKAQQSGAETIEGCMVKDVVITDEGVRVEAIYNRKPCQFHGKLVIGADGVHSTVAKALDMVKRDSKNVVVALRAYYDNVSGDPSLVDLFFDETFFPGYGWIFHLGNGRANVGLGIVQDVYSRYDLNLRKAFDNWVANDPYAQERLGNARLDGRIVGWPLNLYNRDSHNYAERTLLVGDAGNFIDPINGEGIHTALETGVIAASVADEALRANKFGSEFLSRYEHRWREILDLDMRTSDLIITIIQNRSLNPLFMLFLKMVGEKASRDSNYAEVLGGALAGVVPTHHTLQPTIMAKTILQSPGFWTRTLEIPTDGDLSQLINVGISGLSTFLDIINGMAQDPGHTARWGTNVASKGLGLLGSLGNKYVIGTAKYMFGNYLPD